MPLGRTTIRAVSSMPAEFVGTFNGWDPDLKSCWCTERVPPRILGAM